MRSEQSFSKGWVCQDKQGYITCVLVEFPKEDGGGPKVGPSWNTETAGIIVGLRICALA